MGKFDKVLLASDFDNTLVHTQAALDAGTDIPPMPARNREALDYFTANGGVFAVSTGRALPAFSSYVKDLPMINAPCVIANGAGIYDFRTERYVYTAFLGEEVRGHVAELLARFPELAFEIYHADRRIHAIHPNQYVYSHEHLTRALVEPIDSFDQVDFPLVKLLFEDDHPYLEEVFAFMRAQPWIGQYELIFSSPNLLEMTAAGASKGNMVLRLAEHLGVARKDIYCAGDHNNDISMLEVSAIGFAPANATEETRAAAGMVVSHCADGAIADIVEVLDKRY